MYSEDPADYCTEWSPVDDSECLTWNFCDFSEYENGYVCNHLEDYCNEYDVDGLTCIDFTDPGSKHGCTRYDTADGYCMEYASGCYINDGDSGLCLTEVDTW